MRVKRQPARIDPNGGKSVGEGPSSTESSNALGSISPGPPLKKFKLPVYYPVGGGEPVVATGARPPAEHNLNYCHKPCAICYSPDHPSAYCTFTSQFIQKGAVFNRDHYYIACGCGNPFNEQEWACASCSGTMPRLKLKCCCICNEDGHHLSHECPNNKEEAAFYKALRDHDLLYGRYNTKKMPAGISL